MPIENSWDEMNRWAIELADTIKHLTAKEDVRPRQQIKAMQKLSNIFKLNLGEDNTGNEITATTSATPITKAAVTEMPRVHGRLTCNNMTRILPTFEAGNKNEKLATSKRGKKRKIPRDWDEPTQTNYYDGLKETTDNDEEMKKRRKSMKPLARHRKYQQYARD